MSAAPGAAPEPPLPSGFALALAAATRVHDGGRLLLGGRPGRALRLSDGGRDAVARLCAGTAASEADRHLGRRLVEAGLAHPRPPRASARPPVTVVVPVRDRPRALGRCLASLGAGGPVLVVDDGSVDPGAVAAACARHGARVMRRPRPGGPAAARNAALAGVDTDLVAFLDSDCIVPAGWLGPLAAHLADPLVAAVAPRVRPPAAPPGASGWARYAAARSPLDMGPEPADVGPGAAVSYVPTAALLARRAALGPGFDPALRFGEDVDLVWRLRRAGWRVRYDPTVVVEHAEPAAAHARLARRARYGTSAAPLARRHPGDLPLLVVRPWPAAAALLALAGRPGPALAVAAAPGLPLARRLRRLGAPPGLGPRLALAAAGGAVVGLGRATTVLAAPALVAAVARPRARRPALVLLALPPLSEWWRRRPALDPVRYVAAAVADDAAYGLGVWRGCRRAGTFAPLRPVVRGRRSGL